mgnify:CR=1 FL=1|jgi:hypothetical protein|tara:strand:+ start:6516 stop:6854 length:339 start_codon:yes stop_codon:yes gene_type:complete
MGNHFVKDMDSVWHWLNECHMSATLCKPQALQDMADNMRDSSVINQYGSQSPEESTSTNEDVYWWNRLQGQLPNPSVKLPHIHQADDPGNNESTYDTALLRNRIGKVSFIHY